MIIIRSPRQEIEVIIRNFFPAINMYRRTRLLNVMHKEIISEEYLGAVIINELLTEVELLFNRKLVNTFGKKISVKFTEAQAAVFYKSLIALPLERDQVFYQNLRNQWVEELDGLLIRAGFYQRAVQLKQ